MNPQYQLPISNSLQVNADIDQLKSFSAGSANDHTHKHLWVKGASLFIPQMNKLLEHADYSFTITKIEDFQNNCEELGKILAFNRSDKSTTHNYHILYSFIFDKLGVNSNLNILEIGLGTNNPYMVSSMGSGGRPGASLYSFRDYLPNTNIYGCDIDRNILFESERIKTFYVDQLDFATFDDFSTKIGNTKFDLIIDDGLHSIGANFNTLLFALDNLNENGWIAIEDIQNTENWKSIDFVLNSTKKYKTYMIAERVSYIYIVNKL
jgi:hypothetical protein